MGAADGVDARARRVAARLLPSRVRRSIVEGPVRGVDGRRDDRLPRHRPNPGQASALPRVIKTLEHDGWTLLSNAPRPGRSGLVIDHLAVGPGGVVVIDSRHWVGRIEVTRGVVQQNGFWREQECAAVARTAGSVAALLPPGYRSGVHALICVVQHDLPQHLVAPGVHVVGVSELPRALRSLPHRLVPAEVARLRAELARLLIGGQSVDQLTTAEIDGRPGVGRLIGAHREPVDPGPSSLFVPLEGRALRRAARTAPRRKGAVVWWSPRPRSPWGPVVRWSPASPAVARRTGRARDWQGSRGRRSGPPLMAVRMTLLGLLAIAALLIGPGVVRGLTASTTTTPGGPVPVGSVNPGRPGDDGQGSGAPGSGAPGTQGSAPDAPARNGTSPGGPPPGGSASSGAVPGGSVPGRAGGAHRQRPPTANVEHVVRAAADATVRRPQPAAGAVSVPADHR